jgi:hypothetical protein
MTWVFVLSLAFMMALAFAQNVSFTIVSRSRNRNSMKYHLVAAVFSNAVWFATSKFLIVGHDMTWALFVPYTIGTVSGSLAGQWISMKIEKAIGATT